MNSGPDAARVQMLPQRIPVFRSNYKKMKIMFSARWDFRDLDGCVAEFYLIIHGMSKATRVPLAKVTQFHRKYSGLECIKPRVRSDNHMNVF